MDVAAAVWSQFGRTIAHALVACCHVLLLLLLVLLLQAASAELARLKAARAAVSHRIADLEDQLGLIVQEEEELLQQHREGE
jgi:cell division protein FtsB